MLFILKLFISLIIPLVTQNEIVTVLSIVVVFFLILLILGVRKSYKLKKENERLNNINTLQSEEDNKTYKDFTEGHMYDNN
ncbi:hypothetical protein [Snuella sedimenti]|uniref:Uncharacterized protein n=1 Tax=Snuella sedimenti TaxID=2798802 RepID=A0A8J7IHR5_9FLAO|nr:hypothetical protein [Snuella sedimenti]MBJ6368733.1 hypothetical protein [Snuella sedimenti]